MTALIINNSHLPIQTVTPQQSIGEVIISADRRSTKDNPLSDAQRIRRVVLPANSWGELVAQLDGARSQALTDMLRGSLVKLASDKLRDALEETPSLQQVPLSDYSVSALLAWSEETATSRGSITFTRQQVEEWFTNKLWPQLASNYSSEKQPAIMLFLRNRYGALAAKNHGLAKADDATKLVAIIPAELTEEALAVELIGRLTHIEKQLTAKASEATVSMEDL